MTLLPPPLTPAKYWRVAASIASMDSPPSKTFMLPECIGAQSRPPTVGDGIVLADYERVNTTGIIGYIGVITSGRGSEVTVDWRRNQSEIWVDTAAGKGRWGNQDGFGFAATKVAGYGLHQLFAGAFEGMVIREQLPAGTKASLGVARQRASRGRIPPERLNPIEVIGERTSAPRGGYIYVLESALGYKVGRTINVPNRMRAFGVKLPFVYTIPLIAWFDDHIDAEKGYHRLFGNKLINGEWFDLDATDLSLIRARSFS